MRKLSLLVAFAMALAACATPPVPIDIPSPSALAEGQGTLAMVADVNGLSQVFVLSSDGSDQRMVSDGKHAAI